MLISWLCFVHMECYVLLLWKRTYKKKQSTDVLNLKPWYQMMSYTFRHAPYKISSVIDVSSFCLLYKPSCCVLSLTYHSTKNQVLYQNVLLYS